MTRTIKSQLILLAVALFASPFLLQGQETYKLGDGSRIWVEGTSTLRNWQAEVATFSGSVITDASGEIAEVNLSMDVKSMDGGRGPDMNAKIYKALHAEEHPQMTFNGKKAATTEGDVGAYGTLVVGGVSKAMLVSANGSLSAGQLTGEHKIKFSEFNIEPPSALFGQIVCHDDLVVKFELNLVK